MGQIRSFAGRLLLEQRVPTGSKCTDVELTQQFFSRIACWSCRRGRGRIVGEIVVDLPRPRTVATTELPAFVNFTREVRRHLNSASAIE